jgi:hypothetical protein
VERHRKGQGSGAPDISRHGGKTMFGDVVVKSGEKSGINDRIVVRF